MAGNLIPDFYITKILPSYHSPLCSEVYSGGDWLSFFAYSNFAQILRHDYFHSHALILFLFFFYVKPKTKISQSIAPFF
jgi:hypothetical protein